MRQDAGRCSRLGNVVAYVARITQRPAYVRAMEIAGPGPSRPRERRDVDASDDHSLDRAAERARQLRATAEAHHQVGAA